MTKVARIRFTSDEHHCETCGWSSDDYGIEVWLDDKKIIDHPAGASCFGNSSECYSVLGLDCCRDAHQQITTI